MILPCEQRCIMREATMASRFKGAHFPAEVILMGVRWYLAYPLSTRHVEALMEERGVEVDHSTMNRWVIKYSPQLEEAFHRRKRPVWVSWRMEMCQTQPVKMPWCPLRRFAKTLCHLRGGVKREQEMHVHVFSRDDDFADQALRNGLPFFKREPRKIRPQQLAKGRGIVNHLLPLDALLSRVGQLPTFLLNLLQRGSQLLPPRLELT